MPYLPFVLNVEPGNICNLKCPLCPTGLNEPGAVKGFMDQGIFNKVFDQLKDSLRSINLYSWGEPLLNKNLISMIRRVKDYNDKIRITISTNLNVKDNALLNDLIASGVDEIIVSCDGSNQESYSRYRVGGNFALVMDNLESLVKYKKELGRDTAIVWNFLVFRHNEKEIDRAAVMAKDIGVDFRIGLMRTSMKDEILKSHKEAIARDLDWIPDNPLYSAYDKEKLTPRKIMKTCRKPWQEISINWDGKVFPCCAVYGDQYAFGDVKAQTIKDIWNNIDFVSARRQILKRNVPVCSICGICRDNGFMHM